MSTKKLTEATSKSLILSHCSGTIAQTPFLPIHIKDGKEISWEGIVKDQAWLENPLVVKVDQLIKRRGKLGLVQLNVSLEQVKNWIYSFHDKEVKVGSASGHVNRFIIEPYIAHTSKEEYYISIYSTREGDEIIFHDEGGVDVGDVDTLGKKLPVSIDTELSEEIVLGLIDKVPEEKKKKLASFILKLFQTYRSLYFTYLEINPLVVTDNDIYVIDVASSIDQTAEQYEVKPIWGEIHYLPPFGRDMTKEEKYIAELDSKGGASLKLTVLNPEGRIWTMVAGGGASVIYSDTICSLGAKDELANYGEYSGAPSEAQTYEYAKTILCLMTKTKHEKGKVLIIGGGIANFTNVAETFKGIIRAIYDFKDSLIEHNVSIYVRRGGPNYQEGLKLMQQTGEILGLPMHVFGPETHMTSIISMALGFKKVKKTSLMSSSGLYNLDFSKKLDGYAKIVENEGLFSKDTRAIIYGMQPKAVQEMLDFDQCCKRPRPSVAAMVYPFSANHIQRFYWGTEEIILPVYQHLSEAIQKHKDVTVLINYASLRSAVPSTMEALDYSQIKVISIIAEGIPEQKTKQIISKAKLKGVTIIGPATVGAIKPGCFKIGNTGGKIDNILSSRLYRPGNVAYISRSGGMSNELNNIISLTTNGVYEGVAIGGDRYPGSTFHDHVMRFQKDENVKMIVLLGEVGGIEEYKIVDSIKEGKITKPIVAWCMGTCASYFSSDVQFGHAGALANSTLETAVEKNKALKGAGCHVPDNFQELLKVIKKVYFDIKGTIELLPEPIIPQVPIDYAWAQELGLIRKPTSFITSISDERGEELIYGGMPISQVFEQNLGIGGVVSLLWFKRKLPDYICKFIEMCLVITADHGPAVSGAHNTIVTARAGKDLVSSLTAGLLTIGDRFGGALDGSAKQFSEAFDNNLTPQEFVNKVRDDKKLIMGIGHRVKSINSPDKRVEIIKNYVKEHFPKYPLLTYAEEVEKITTSKKPNLILNVDGVIAVSFVDMLRHCSFFTKEEAKEYIDVGLLNGIFVLGRSIGFIGHYIDQNRLKQGLYRHPWEDISYIDSLKTEFAI